MSKIVIYQLLPRLMGNTITARIPHGTLSENGAGKFNDITPTLLRRIHDLGATHIWFTGVLRHATTTDYTSYGIPRQAPCVVKGKAGSPYAICDYYDVDPDLATKVHRRMAQFERLIKRTHEAGMQVVIDFVPNHVAREYHSIAKPQGVADFGADDDRTLHFSTKNDFYYCVGAPFVSPVEGAYEESPARATGNDCFTPSPSINDWYETAKLNYGIDYNDWSGIPSYHFAPRPQLWDKMVDILLFWAGKGVDAFRCDMAEMVPLAFWEYATRKVKELFPHIIYIGEVYNKALYRDYISAGFDYLYDKVGMYDTLRAVVTHQCPSADITARWQETDDIRSRMLYFLENHDEQRIASDFFAGDAQRAIPAFIVAALLYSNPLLLYAGQEFGERGMDAEGFSGLDGRTTIFDYWCVESLRRGSYARRSLTKEEKSIEKQYKRILGIARQAKLETAPSFDLMYANPQLHDQQFAFLRGRRTASDSGRGNSMLVAVNFSERAADVPIALPAHAFDFLNMKEQTVTARDLLSNTTFILPLQRNEAVNITIPQHNGVVLTW